jgi:Transposase IS4
MFYLGKGDETALQERSISHDTVLKLLQPLEGKYHCVFMDNFYTGVPLFYDLQKMKIHTTGTVRTNRKGLDPAVMMKKEEERRLKANAGTQRYSSCGCLVFAAWFDKRPVHMLSNCISPVAGDKKVRVSFGTTDHARWSSNDNHLSNLIEIPLLEGQKTARRRQLYYIQEDCNFRTTKMCRACRAPLCFPGCYLAYHKKTVTK